VLGVAVLLADPRADAQEAPVAPAPLQPPLEGRKLRVPSGSGEATVDLGCEGRASVQAGSKVYVACGADGVVEVDLSSPGMPRVAGRMSVGGDATGLFLRDGRPWVEVAQVDARPVRMEVQGLVSPQPAPSPAAAPEPPTAGAPETRHGLLAPPRHGGIWELSAMAGAFVNLGPLGGGGMGWASAVYRFDAPIVVRAELAPVGVAIGLTQTTTYSGFNQNSGNNPNGATGIGAAHLLVGLDTQFVEVAVGGGGATSSNSYGYGGASGATAGATIVEEGRLGARDGLALHVESIAVATNNQFQFGSFVATIQVPLTQSVMMIVRGGGGNVGLLFGDVGARYVVRGDGGPDTIALTGFFGGAGIDFTSCIATGGQAGAGCQATQSVSMGGPSIGGGVEWRR